MSNLNGQTDRFIGKFCVFVLKLLTVSKEVVSSGKVVLSLRGVKEVRVLNLRVVEVRVGGRSVRGRGSAAVEVRAGWIEL